MIRHSNSGPSRPRRAAWIAATWLVLAALPGCSGEGQRAPAVDPVRAREVLRTVLDGWKRGDTPQSLKSASPPIVVQDFDWSAGLKLVGYEVTGDGKDDDANLKIPVELTLAEPQGRQSKKKVTFIVGTSPALTVFRDRMP